MTDDFGNARRLQVLFRSLLTLAGAGTACVVMMTSCSGDMADEPSPTCRIADDASRGSGCWDYNVELAPGASAAACGLPADGGRSYERELCDQFCNPSGAYHGYVTCSFVASKNAIACSIGCPVDGRRPPRLGDTPSDRSTLGAWLATMAFHEAASVDAFEILGEELRAHGAPRSILRSIARARADEVRHARRAGSLARRHGSRPRKPRVPRSQRRDLFTIALENAREGCARETFGALIGFHQASHARTPELRAFYRAIARDELRHAALSWRMHEFMMTRLSASERDVVDRAVRDALATMHVDADTELRDTLGLPSPAMMGVLRDRVARQLGRGYATDARIRRSAASASR